MELTRTESGSTALAATVAKAEHYILNARSKNTVKAYRSDWRHFLTWCAGQGIPALPAEPKAVALYIAELADEAKVSTITRRLAAISKTHQTAGFESPCAMRHAAVAEVLSGIRRTKGTASQGKAALLTVHIRQLIQAVPDSRLGLRDAAILLLGFAGGFRRAELAAMKVEDVEFCEDGLKVTLRRSKTDQDGRGRSVGITYGSNPATCPVRTLKRWLETAGITAGPVFRSVNKSGRIGSSLSPQVVRLIVMRWSVAAGLDASKFSAHSLRSGLATQAAVNGASERSIMAQTGHKSVAMVRRYIREGSLFRENAASRLGL
jgi:site-specific recombinase XerD